MIITVFVAFVCIYTAAKIWISEERTTVFNKKKIEVKGKENMEQYLKLLLEQIRCKRVHPYIKEEIQAHIEDQIEDNIQLGMTMEEAEKAAKEKERLASLSEEEMNEKEKEQFAALQKERQNDSLRLLVQTERKKFDVEYDEFKEITWLYSKTRPAYANTKAFYTYIGINKQGHAWCRLVIRYHGEDWLFVKSIIIKTDNNTYTLAADNVQRDHNTEVWEWIDINVGEGEDIILYDIIHSKQTKIRFVGYQYHYDWTLPAKTIKGLKEIYDTVGDITTGLLSDTTANPFFKLEATGEYLDRSANFIRQCKRYAKKNKLDWKDVLKKSNKDPKLFAELNDGVNKALGDYIGRIYALPFGMYDIISESVPFYRFLTQTARTSANQLMHYPFAFASNVTVPSRIGSPISEYILNNYNLNKDMYNGGVIYDDDNGQYMVAGFEPLPAGTLLESGGNTLSGKDLMSILSPTLTTIPNLISYRKFNRVPSSPGLHDDMHDPRKMLRSKEELNSILNEIEKLFPNAGCELNYNNVFELLIAVMLSAQTTDKRVNMVTKKLFTKYDTLDKNQYLLRINHYNYLP